MKRVFLRIACWLYDHRWQSDGFEEHTRRALVKCRRCGLVGYFPPRR